MAPPDAIDQDTVVVANAIEVLYSMQQTRNSLQMGLDNNPVDEGFPDGRPRILRAVADHIPRQTEHLQELLQSAVQKHREHQEKIQEQIEELAHFEAMITRARRSLTGSPNMPSDAEQKRWLQNYDDGQEPGPAWLLSRTTLMQPPAPPASSDDRRFTDLWTGGIRMMHRQDAAPAPAPEVIAAGQNQIEPVEEIDY